jgi:hypothetical protein
MKVRAFLFAEFNELALAKAVTIFYIGNQKKKRGFQYESEKGDTEGRCRGVSEAGAEVHNE